MNDDDFVDVYVCEGGGGWSETNSIRFLIPSSIFDLKMAVGELNTIEDLEAAVLDRQVSSDDAPVTQIYAAADGTWSGCPSLHFKMPNTIFNFLVRDKNRSRKMGWLTSQEDVEKLITETNNQIDLEAKGIRNISDGPCCTMCRKILEEKNEDGGGGGEVNDVCRNCQLLIEGGKMCFLSRTEIKSCTHLCTVSSFQEGCCKCLDLRPIQNT